MPQNDFTTDKGHAEPIGMAREVRNRKDGASAAAEGEVGSVYTVDDGSVPAWAKKPVFSGAEMAKVMDDAAAGVG